MRELGDITGRSWMPRFASIKIINLGAATLPEALHRLIKRLTAFPRPQLRVSASPREPVRTRTSDLRFRSPPRASSACRICDHGPLRTRSLPVGLIQPLASLSARRAMRYEANTISERCAQPRLSCR